MMFMSSIVEREFRQNSQNYKEWQNNESYSKKIKGLKIGNKKLAPVTAGRLVKVRGQERIVTCPLVFA